jgi:hypothetical protein
LAPKYTFHEITATEREEISSDLENYEGTLNSRILFKSSLTSRSALVGNNIIEMHGR